MYAACGGSAKTATITANFASACSGITLAAPANNFVLTGSGNNSLPVQIMDYTVANLQSITLENANADGNSWVADTTVLQSNITDPTRTVNTKLVTVNGKCVTLPPN